MPSKRKIVPQRGRVYLAPLGEAGDKYWLCVSNNVRNSKLDEFLAVRLTTSPKPSLPTIVELRERDAPFVGRVLCDDLGPIYLDQVVKDAGALSAATMREVERGLKVALALD